MASEAQILIVDFGSQYTHLIARKVREAGVWAEVVSGEDLPGRLGHTRLRGLILSGSHYSVDSPGSPRLRPEVYRAGIPILGICYGAQLLTQELGGSVSRNNSEEYGRTAITIDRVTVGEALLMLPEFGKSEVWMSHASAITTVPLGFTVTARSGDRQIAVMEDQVRKFYGVQFHPEVAHSPRGNDLIRRFLFEICDCTAVETADSFLQGAIEDIRVAVGEEKVICAVSGGIDSTVTATIINSAVPGQTIAVFVDSGFLRQNEAVEATSALRELLQGDLLTVNAEPRFLGRLAGIANPERKRKMVGEQFVREFETIAAYHGATFLAQGTIYPDRIESGLGVAARIKTHHNVGGLPPDMSLRLLEPLRDLFKDEVRALARTMGLPGDVIEKKPFPGPGLALDVLGAVSKRKIRMVRAANVILEQELTAAGIYDDLWQAFAVLLPSEPSA
jgi:GMP synthase (glutamine-hydrolysing)